MHTHFRMQRSFATGQIELAIFQKIGDRVFIAEPLTFKELGKNELAEHATYQISLDDPGFFHSFFEESQLLGIKPPSEVTGNEIDAVKNHLEDMRKLVFEERYDVVKK